MKPMLFPVYLVPVILILFFMTAKCLAATSTQTLHTYILSNHDAKSHPDHAVNVSFDGSLYQLVEVDEVQQSLKVLIWLTQTWIDPTLAWPSSVSNANETYLPEELVWRPDILLLNQLDNNEIYDTTPNYVQVSSNGRVLYQYPIIYTSSCLIDVSMFPFDKQTCEMKFGAWMLPITMVDMWPGDGSVDLTQTLENTLWNIKDVTMTRNMKYYECCPQGYSVDITLTFHLERQPEYYYFTLIIPSIIISAVSLMGTFFQSQSDGARVEKTTLGITTMLTMAVFLLMVADDLPEDSTNVPLISIFVFIQILINTSGTICAALIMKQHCKDLTGQPVPDWLIKFITKVFRLPKENTEMSHVQMYGKDKGTKTASEMNWAQAMEYVDRLAMFLHLTLLVLITVVCLLIVPAACSSC